MLERDGPVTHGIQVRQGGAQRLAGDVRAAELIGLVHARVVLASGAVAVGERADVPRQPAVVAKGVREARGEEHLIDALVRLQVAVRAIGLVIGVDDDGGGYPRVAVREVQLGPGSVDRVGEVPGLVVGARDARRFVQLITRGGVAPGRYDDAERRCSVARITRGVRGRSDARAARACSRGTRISIRRMSSRRWTSALPPLSARWRSARRTAETRGKDRSTSPGRPSSTWPARGADRRRQHRAAARRASQPAEAVRRELPAVLPRVSRRGAARGPAGGRRGAAAGGAVPELPPVPAPCAYAASPNSKPARANERNASLIDVCPSQARVGWRQKPTERAARETFTKNVHAARGWGRSVLSW